MYPNNKLVNTTYAEKVTRYQAQIQQALDRLVLPEQPERLYAPIRYFLGLGGKRMRPVMCMLGYELFAEDSEKALPAALALELFHNFTLLHDDIMDKADKRRGQATVHAKWDENVAILSGDTLFVLAYDQLTYINPAKLPAVMRAFNRIAREVCEGQQLDMDYQGRAEVSLNEYLHMIRLKTSVLLGGCLEIGAILGGADEKQAHLAYVFGEKVGLAFQIQDDLLDAYGDPKKFGKKVGGDILVNKHTFLRMSAEALALGEMADDLKAAYAETDEKAKITRVKALFDTLGVPQKAELKKQELLKLAFGALDQLETTQTDVVHQLKALAFYLVERES